MSEEYQEEGCSTTDAHRAELVKRLIPSIRYAEKHGTPWPVSAAIILAQGGTCYDCAAKILKLIEQEFNSKPDLETKSFAE